MNDPSCRQVSPFIEGFSLTERVLMRIGFYGFIIIGAYGIFLHSIPWGVAYSGYAVCGSLAILYSLCAHCPYPHKLSTCLFLPTSVVKALFHYRPEPMSRLDKVVMTVSMAGLVVIPQYWLIKEPLVLAVFWLFCAPVFVVIPLSYCRRCRHTDCPFNMVKAEVLECP